jgi:hypothetical protein
MKNNLFFLILSATLLGLPIFGNAQVIKTFAGGGLCSFCGDGGPATAAGLQLPFVVATDGAGNLYIADDINERIRKVNSSGIITTIAGNGGAGYTGDGGPATNATFQYPRSVAADGSGNIYVGDNLNYVLRKINSSGIISTFAGNGISGYSGDGGPATNAKLGALLHAAADALGNIYIADLYNSVIRKVNSSGIISTIAGTGTGGYSGDGGTATAAQLQSPYQLAVDGTGNIYFADAGNNRVRKINTSGIITTVAGNGTAGYIGDGGLATAAELNGPYGVAVDASGTLFIGDNGNNVVRKVSGGIITTYAGDTVSGFSGDAGPATAAELNQPSGLAIDGSGVLYIGDKGNNRVRKVTVCALPLVGTITGSSNVCIGSTITISDTTAGGLWSSVSGFATVGSSSGIVTGLSSGVAAISYSVTNSCGTATVIKTITVNPLPNSGSITGDSVLCEGATITMTNTATGGVWSSGSTSIATIGSGSGVVNGVLGGTVTISYTATNICGMANSIKSITVNPLPDAGSISGANTVCEGDSISVSDSAIGIWSSSDSSVAKVSATGMVTGITNGIAIISYTASNSCGSISATKIFTVIAAALCPTIVNELHENVAIKIFPNPSLGDCTVEINNQTNVTSITIFDLLGKEIIEKTIFPNTVKQIFTFGNLPTGTYIVKIASRDFTYREKLVVW